MYSFRRKQLLYLEDYGTPVDVLGLVHYYRPDEKHRNDVSSLTYINFDVDGELTIKGKSSIDGVADVNIKSGNTSLNYTASSTVLSRDLNDLMNSHQIEEITINNAEKVNGNLFEVNIPGKNKDLRLCIDKDNRAFISDKRCDIFHKDDKDVPSEVVKYGEKHIIFYDYETGITDYSLDKGRIARFQSYCKATDPYLDHVIFKECPSKISILNAETEEVLHQYQQQFKIDAYGLIYDIIDLDKKQSMVKTETIEDSVMVAINSIKPILFDPFNFENSMSNIWVAESLIVEKNKYISCTRKTYRIPEYKNDELIYRINMSKQNNTKILDYVV